jgi:hypothetical protein
MKLARRFRAGEHPPHRTWDFHPEYSKYSLRNRGRFDTLMPGQRLILARFRAEIPRIVALHPPVQLTDDGNFAACPRDAACGIDFGILVNAVLLDGLHGAMPLGMTRMADSMAPAAAEVAQ